jgi:hypothetical protein
MSYHQDLENMTRDMHDASMEVEYMQKTPVLSLILERKSTKFNGGAFYYKEVDTDTVEDLAQDYVNNEPLTHGTQDTTEQVFFGRKKFQIPVQIDLDEELQNALDNEDGTQLQNLAKFKVQKVQEAGRLHLRKLIYGRASDSAKQIQGLGSALDITTGASTTYGKITRSATVNPWWQPCDNRYTNTTQATEYHISIDWLQEVIDPLVDLENGSGDFVIVVGNALWLALKSEAQARSMPIKLDPKGKAKFGIQEMEIDDMRIVKDPFLQSKYNTEMGMTTGAAGGLERRLYALNLKDWDLFIHPKRNFLMTPFFDQKQIAGGADFTMARLLVAGNLVCWHPNRQLYLANVTV